MLPSIHFRFDDMFTVYMFAYGEKDGRLQNHLSAQSLENLKPSSTKEKKSLIVRVSMMRISMITYHLPYRFHFRSRLLRFSTASTSGSYSSEHPNLTVMVAANSNTTT